MRIVGNVKVGRNNVFKLILFVFEENRYLERFFIICLLVGKICLFKLIKKYLVKRVKKIGVRGGNKYCLRVKINLGEMFNYVEECGGIRFECYKKGMCCIC